MLNIHRKIEAKNMITINVCELSKINNLSPSHTLKRFYEAFDNYTFTLHYEIRKLSKRARRNKI